MRLPIFIILIAFFSFAHQYAYSQNDTSHLRISLITCGPGDELYSTFGHTAIRVIDSVNKMDIAFNYGIFDDSDPYFYVKFTRGIMRYYVAAEYFSDFMHEYIADKRSVTEQELMLTSFEKTTLYAALKVNIREENKYYDYQFYKDNCTTRAKDIIKKSTSNKIYFRAILPKKKPTFRQLIHEYLDSGHHAWDKFGIDLVLGSHLDEKPTDEQSMFLPDYLMKGFDSALLLQYPIVSNKKVLYSGKVNSPEDILWFTPFNFFAVVCLLFMGLSFNQSTWAQKTIYLLDNIFFCFIGLLGWLMATVWVGRIDEVCRNNMNLLWAWPTHLVFAFFTKKDSVIIKKYFRIVGIISIILLLGWFWWPQQFNPAFAPIIIITAIRGFFISNK